MTIATTDTRLSPDEDEALRRLHYFERVGAVLSPDMHGLQEELRARDLRDEIREPAEPVALIPMARSSVA